MSRDWNGLDLQSEFSALLGDESDSFKTKVLSWMNEVQLDICSQYDWAFLRFSGEKVLTTGEGEQSLVLDQASAPTVAIATGGSLTDTTQYKILVTFYEGQSKAESIQGVESATVTATATDKQIDITAIPVSADPLVTARRVYIAKKEATDTAFGEFLLDQTIADNTTTTATITTETTSLVEPPDYDYFRKLDGNPFLETASQLSYRPIDQIRLLFQGDLEDSTGTPFIWSNLQYNRLYLYNPPSSALKLSFYYFRNPEMMFAEKTSQPEMPIYLKSVLRAGVIALGYEYRDRDGQEGKRNNYDSALATAFSTFGRVKKVTTRVRDVVGNSDSREI